MQQTIRIKRVSIMREPAEDEIDADVEGCWAIHEAIPLSLEQWTLTHIPTGYVFVTTDTHGQCLACRAELMAGDLDWVSIEKPSDMTPEHRAMGKRLRAKYEPEQEP